MKRLLCAFLFCVTFCAAEEAHGAYQSYGRVGAWNIDYDDESHECFAHVAYSDQSQFLVGRTAVGGIYIIALNPQWRFTEGQQYELTVELAQSSASVKKGSAFFGAIDPITIAATNFKSTFLEDLKQAKGITFYYNDRFLGAFNLTGLDIAVEKVEECRSYLGKQQARVKTGSGVYVSASEQMPGTILTNEHVIHGCVEIRVGYPGGQYVSAEVLAHDEDDDLALLSTMLPGKGQAAFSTSAKLGQDVAAFGFPMAGILSPGGNFTTGTISALDAGNDPRYLQMSNAIQPGNSGGPLLDRKGNVVGIVEAQGNLSLFENVNFAIKAATAIKFLEDKSIRYSSARGWLPKFWTGVANTAQTFTVQIICSEQQAPPQAPPSQPREQPRPPQPRASPTTMSMRVLVLQDLSLRTAPDPQSEKVMVGPPLNDAIPKDATVEVHYTDLKTDCRRYDADAGHMIWCPISYYNNFGWVNAFYLGTGNGRLSCSIDKTSRGCNQNVVVRTIADLTLRAAPDPHSEKVLEKIPNGSQVMIIEQCQVWMGSGRGAQDADNLWCKVIYGTYGFYQGWANAYYLAVSDGRRLACVRYPRAQGCPPALYGSR